MSSNDKRLTIGNSMDLSYEECVRLAEEMAVEGRSCITSDGGLRYATVSNTYATLALAKVTREKT